MEINPLQRLKAKASSVQAKIALQFSLLMALFASATANAQGLQAVTQLATDVTGVLTGLGVAVVTIAIMWCGYIMLFSRGNTSQIPYILGGGVIIGGAAQIAAFIVN